MQKLAVTAGRVLLGVYFLLPGLSKIPGYAGTLDYMLLHQIPLTDILLSLNDSTSGRGWIISDRGLSTGRNRADAGWIDPAHQSWNA